MGSITQHKQRHRMIKATSDDVHTRLFNMWRFAVVVMRYARKSLSTNTKKMAPGANVKFYVQFCWAACHEQRMNTVKSSLKFFFHLLRALHRFKYTKLTTLVIQHEMNEPQQEILF